MAVENGRFRTPRDLLNRGDGRSDLIDSVSDNLRSSETAKYYRVVGSGFGEDCPAFVDRYHQWNGVDAQGIPPFLLGGDYVMTFNDDKIRKVQISMKLSKPASVYVLLDNRVPVPAWLKEDFADTGWNIGLDEANADRDYTNTGLGPGHSIDYLFSVWRQDFPEATTAKLGPIRQQDLDVRPRSVRQNMYGIVVTKLVDPQHEAIY